jgi:hypothetical protein
MLLGGRSVTAELLGWFTSKKQGLMSGHYLYRGGPMSSFVAIQDGDLIARQSSIQRSTAPHTSRHLWAFSSGRYSLMKSMNARSLGVMSLPEGHSSRKVFCSVVYSSRIVTKAPASRAARTENSDM